LKRHPLQPIVRDEGGTLRFSRNAIVRALLDHATARGMGMNELILMPFSINDREQLLQLIGYSVSGISELDYVREKTIERVDAAVARFKKLEYEATTPRETAITEVLDEQIRGDGHCIELSRQDLHKLCRLIWDRAEKTP
jgi:hypothetical protein